MNTDDQVDADLCPFAFVGCWNREFQRSNTQATTLSPRDVVATAIRRALRIPTVILGGDNIYVPTLVSPDGTEQIKLTGKPKKPRYELEAFRRGARLYTSMPHLWVAIGNHNVDPRSDFDIYAEQRATFRRSLPAPYYTRQFRDGRRIVVIDTNVMEHGREAEFAVMCEWLASVASRPEPYLLVQHVPMICLSSVRRDGSWSRPVLKRVTELLDIFLRPGVTPPTAILCADTHNYQYGIVSYKGLDIPQFVVGTGGARPDPLPATMTDADRTYTPAHIPDLTYSLRSYVPSYGFLMVTAADSLTSILDQKGEARIFYGDMMFQYVPVAPWSPSYTRRGGGRRRTRGQRRRHRQTRR